MNFFDNINYSRKNRDNNLQLIITSLLIVFPILSRYASLIRLINLSEFISILLLLYVMLFKFKFIKLDKYFLLLIMYVILQSTLLLSVYPDSISDQLLGTALRFVYIYLILNIFGKNFFNMNVGKKIMVHLTLFLSIYALIQYYLATKGIILTTYIPGLKIMEGVRELENVDDILVGQMNYGLQFRPRSLLNEPAHLGTYIVSALTIVLFNNKKLGLINLIYAFIFSLTCMLSRSSTAIIIMILIWTAFIIKNIKSRENQDIAWIILIFLLLIVIYSMFKDIKSLNYFMTKTFGKSRSIYEIANTTRFNQIKESFRDFNGIRDYIFGKGCIRIDYYLPGFFRLIYNFGFLGFILYLYVLIKSTIKDSDLQKIILLIYIIINIGTEVLYGNFIFIFLPFIINDDLNLN